MPIYEYKCDDCGEAFEVFLSIKAPPVKKCTHCKSSNIRKLVSNCSFQLKGTGWYVTDYAKKDDGKKEDKHKQSDKAKGQKSKTPEKKDTKKTPESGKGAETKKQEKAA